jgi:hypothetical protein
MVEMGQEGEKEEAQEEEKKKKKKKKKKQTKEKKNKEKKEKEGNNMFFSPLLLWPGSRVLPNRTPMVPFSAFLRRQNMFQALKHSPFQMKLSYDPV